MVFKTSLALYYLFKQFGNMELVTLFIYFWEVEWEKLLLYCSLEVELELLEMTGAWERPFENVSFSQPVCQPAA